MGRLPFLFMWEQIQRWRWQRRWQRCDRLARVLRAALVFPSTRDQRFIERLHAPELLAIRESQANRRWRTDALRSLDAELLRLRQLLGLPPTPSEVTHDDLSSLSESDQ